MVDCWDYYGNVEGRHERVTVIIVGADCRGCVADAVSVGVCAVIEESMDTSAA